MQDRPVQETEVVDAPPKLVPLFAILAPLQKSQIFDLPEEAAQVMVQVTSNDPKVKSPYLTQDPDAWFLLDEKLVGLERVEIPPQVYPETRDGYQTFLHVGYVPKRFQKFLKQVGLDAKLTPHNRVQINEKFLIIELSEPLGDDNRVVLPRKVAEMIAQTINQKHLRVNINNTDRRGCKSCGPTDYKPQKPEGNNATVPATEGSPEA